MEAAAQKGTGRPGVGELEGVKLATQHQHAELIQMRREVAEAHNQAVTAEQEVVEATKRREGAETALAKARTWNSLNFQLGRKGEQPIVTEADAHDLLQISACGTISRSRRAGNRRACRRPVFRACCCGRAAVTNHPRPQRIQLSRQGGLSMGRLGLAANGLPTQPVAYYSRWANPFTVERYGCPEALRLYCEYIADRHAEIRRELRGYNLACYCLPEEACHADVLLAIANAENDDLAAST